jgi:hypothetical protein
MNKIFLLFLIVTGLTMFSCSKSESGFQTAVLKTPVDQLVARDGNVDNFVEAADYEADLFSMGEAILSANYTKSAAIGMNNRFHDMFLHYLNFRMRYRNGNGPDITLKTTNGKFPKTIILDYGDSTALANGLVLSGMITIYLSGPDTVTGNTRTITYDNFSNGYAALSGTSSKTRLRNSAQKVFTISSNLTITFSDSTSMNRTGEKNITWVSGAGTPFNPADDIMEITGMIQVTDRKGNDYLENITTSLVKTGECRYITQGIIEFKTSAGKFATLDYGNGECDNIAALTTSNGTKEITLGH